MISDILSETSNYIRNQLEDFPDVYSDMRPRLDALLSEMDAIRKELDTPPSETEPHSAMNDEALEDSEHLRHCWGFDETNQN